MQVGAVALEELVRRQRQENIQVAWRAAAQAGLAFASEITWPRPWQAGQVRSSVKKPWACLILPAPPQVAQGFGLVPALAPEPEQISQVTEVGMRIWAVLPSNASSRVISML